MKNILFLVLMLPFTSLLKAQPFACTFREPEVIISFGNGEISEMNYAQTGAYDRVLWPCPSDGHYTYTSYTSDCFRGDWHTLTEDHTPGDASGNMLLVNASYISGTFFMTPIQGLKPSTTYEFGIWMMNVCRPTEKCPFPLLPDIDIRLQTKEGKAVLQLSTGRLTRKKTAEWTQYRLNFTTPSSGTSYILSMVNYSPGGCGNDFAMDDITFRECVKTNNVGLYTPKPKVENKRPSAVAKSSPSKKTSAATKPSASKKTHQTAGVKKPSTNSGTKSQQKSTATKKPQLALNPSGRPQPSSVEPVNRELKPKIPASPPLIMRKRENTLMKKLQVTPGEIRIDLYDNGEIDGDTVSIYHNNVLVVHRARLSQKPITFRITVNDNQPYHELVMVAENLGSIPPNTSVMIVSDGTRKQEVFISSSEQKNAKVVLGLKE